MKSRTFAFFALVLIHTTGSSETSDPVGLDITPYQYRKELLGNPSGKRLCSVRLDLDIYRNSGGEYEALRLTRQTGAPLEELPWIVVRSEPEKKATRPLRIPHQVESLEENPDGSIDLIISFGDEAPVPAYLEFHTPLRNFEKNVTISIPDSDSSWIPILDGLIFDHERFLDFRRTRLDLPATDSRRFQIHLSDATDEQRSLVRELSRTVSESNGVSVTQNDTVTTRVLRIDELRFFTAPTTKEETVKLQEFTLPILKQIRNQSAGQTEIHLDGGSLPVHEIILTTKDRNFGRAVSVQVPSGATSNEWQTIHRGRIHRYEVGDFQDENLILRFEETRSDRFRVVVEDQDSPPLAISKARGIIHSYELLYLANAGDHCLLFLGDPSGRLSRPQFDTSAITAAYHHEVAKEPLELGGLEPNPEFREAAAPEPNWLDSKPFLWLIIAFVVGILSFVLYRTLQQIETTDNET